MLKQLRLRINNRVVAWAGVFGVGLIPCPDCGIPLAVHVWPVAGVVWLYRRLRRRSEQQLDLLLTDDLRAQVTDSAQNPATSPDATSPSGDVDATSPAS